MKERRVDTSFKIMEENEIDSYVMDEFIDRFNTSYERDDKVIDVESLEQVLDKESFDCEYFKAKVVVNGQWKNVTPSLQQLFEVLKERNLIQRKLESDIDDDTDEDTDDGTDDDDKEENDDKEIK